MRCAFCGNEATTRVAAVGEGPRGIWTANTRSLHVCAEHATRGNGQRDEPDGYLGADAVSAWRYYWTPCRQ